MRQLSRKANQIFHLYGLVDIFDKVNVGIELLLSLQFVLIFKVVSVGVDVTANLLHPAVPKSTMSVANFFDIELACLLGFDLVFVEGVANSNELSDRAAADAGVFVGILFAVHFV